MRKTLSIALGALSMGMLFSATAAEAAPYCREYTKNVTVGGRVQQSYGTACQQPDGSWQVVNEQANGNVGYNYGYNPAPTRVDYVIDNRPIYVAPRPVFRQPSVYINTGYYGGRKWHKNKWHKNKWRNRGRWNNHYGYNNHRGRGYRHGGHHRSHGSISFNW